MTLPRLLLLTDRRASSRPLVEVVSRAVQGGVRAVVLREKDLPASPRRRLADDLLAVLAEVEGLLVLAGSALAGSAVHLAAAEPVPQPRPRLLGRSCHDADEVARAGRDGCDWVTAGPWAATDSKPGYGPPLGPSGLARLTAVPGAPAVFALGGVLAPDVGACLDSGAHGVAVMGSVMRAEQPERVVAELLQRLHAGSPP